MTGAPYRPLELFAALNRHGVDFLVIGGIAVQAHAVPRSTLDVDIVIDRAPANVRRLRDALADLDPPETVVDPLSHVELDPRDEVDLAPGRLLPIPTRAGRLDLVADPPGADHYPTMAERAVALEIDGVAFRVVGLDDLIAMKRAAGRPKDLLDLADLTAPGPRRDGEDD